jgi:hypothetical protein
VACFKALLTLRQKYSEPGSNLWVTDWDISMTMDAFINRIVFSAG